MLTQILDISGAQWVGISGAGMQLAIWGESAAN